ncbi:MAG TPA: ABC transporter permease [Vicinamibacterales bacterium]|nr:ABC transporter permease [Vicinamibacterales bacterium]
MVDTWFKDLAYAARGLRKNAGFTAVATITIALGIGACTAIFSVVNAVLLRPLPYADAQRLVIIWGELRARSVNDWPFSPPDLRDLTQQSTAVFDDVAGMIPPGRVPFAGPGGDPEQIRVGGATPNLFRILGARVAVGRDFVADDATAPPVQPGQPPAVQVPLSAIISHEFWQRRFGGDAGVVGTEVELGGGRAQIVGILAPGFAMLFPPRVNVDAGPDMWTAARIDIDSANRNNVVYRVVGRLKPGVTLVQAQAQADRVAADLREHFPIKKTSGLYFHVVPMFDDLVGDVRPAILSLMGAVAFVLLIASANVANLLVVRASARGRELAVRAAIGASRGQLIRQLLAESFVIAAAGTVLGLLLARWGVDALLAIAPKDLPRLEAVAIDPLVLAFAVASGVVTAGLCGLVPALRASRADVMDALRAAGRSSNLRGGRRLRGSVVVAEVSLSFILLIGAGLMLRSVAALSRVDPGFDPAHVLTFQLQAQARQPEQRAAFMQQVRERIRAIPGVVDASAANPLPLDGQLINGRWGTEAALADAAKYRQATYHFIVPGYFDTLRTRLIAGRVFSDADNNIDQKSDLPRQIVIDDALAKLAFGNAPAVGKRLLGRITTAEPQWYDVIGVVAHQRHASLAVPGPEAIFIANGHGGHGAATHWAVRTTGDPNLIVSAVRAAVASVDPRAPLADVRPMTAFVDKAMAPVRFTATLIGIFAGVAVVLAAVGLYGVLATIVRQRTSEIGMRMVFGAPRRSILNLVVGEGLRLSVAGMIVGVVGALAITRLMTSMLVGVDASDPATFVAIAVLFSVIAMVASLVPAQRAARLDPMAAIREE